MDGRSAWEDSPTSVLRCVLLLSSTEATGRLQCNFYLDQIQAVFFSGGKAVRSETAVFTLTQVSLCFSNNSTPCVTATYVIQAFT